MSIWHRLRLLGKVADRGPVVRPRGASALALGCCLVMLLLSHSALAERGHARGGVHAATTTEDAPAQWRELTPTQREVLAPLARQWGQMDDTAREKWLNVADRYKGLSPAEQRRVRERMAQWSNLPPKLVVRLDCASSSRGNYPPRSVSASGRPTSRCHPRHAKRSAAVPNAKRNQ